MFLTTIPGAACEHAVGWEAAIQPADLPVHTAHANMYKAMMSFIGRAEEVSLSALLVATNRLSN